MSTPPPLEQISISLSLDRNAITPASSVSAERCVHDHAIITEDILRNAGGPMTFNLHERMPPFHICITPQFTTHIRRLHQLLNRALIDIVERWWSDIAANFPGQMPLEKHEEELLRWIDGAGSQFMRPFRERYGMWRSDYLIEKDEGEDGGERERERTRICEINSRIPFNGFWVVGLQMVAARLLRGESEDGFMLPDDFEDVKRCIAGRFDMEKPMYYIRDKWPGVDSHQFQRYWAEQTGKSVMTVKPSQLRVREDAASPTGQTLYYVPKNGSAVDDTHDSTSRDITQCSVELFQEELSTIDISILRQLATCCTNDLRNVLLLHDKRILGIVRRQLPNLVARSILTKDESTLLEEGIIETILPGTPSMKNLLTSSTQDPIVKDKYIIKPVRDASCNDIHLGRNISQIDWVDTLERLSAKHLRPSEDAYVVQRLVDHVWYDIVTHDEGGLVPEKYHLIGSQHMIGGVEGDVDVFGPWRLGKEVHVGFKEGTKKGIVMGSVVRSEGTAGEARKREGV